MFIYSRTTPIRSVHVYIYFDPIETMIYKEQQLGEAKHIARPLSITSSGLLSCPPFMPSSLINYPCLLRDHYKQSHHTSMLSLSSPLALKGQLKLSTTTALLIAAFILTLYINSCEARHLRVHGKGYCSGKLPSSPPKGAIDGNGAKGKMGSSPEVPVESNMDAPMGNEAVNGPAKKEIASSGDSCLGSLRERFDGIKARSSLRERSMLGAESNREQLHVVSNATTAYTAETLVAMDYLDAHPAPAVHNR